MTNEATETMLAAGRFMANKLDEAEAEIEQLRARIAKLEGHRNDWRRRAVMARDLLERASKLIAASNSDHPMLDEIDGCLSAMLADDEAQRTPHPLPQEEK